MVLSIMVSGHRPGKLGGYTVNPIARHIRKELHDIMAKARHRFASCVGITGMAQGVDQWFAEVCRGLSIPYIAYIPFPGQERLWPSDAQEHYRQLVADASEVRVGPPVRTMLDIIAAFQRRNSEMVSGCHAAIAVWDGSSGGTADAVRTLTDLGRPLLRLDPRQPFDPATVDHWLDTLSEFASSATRHFP
ncbi:MAG: DUF1273 family protein [Nitrospira sp. CR1.3]|nr:DUF1273 family protein [Nitrospira sp. CR1.3]